MASVSERPACASKVEVASAKKCSTPADRVNALMQAHRQCRRHTANYPWFEFCQQLDKRAPAFDPLVTSDVSAHGVRIGFCRQHGKPVAYGLNRALVIRRPLSGA